MGVLPAVSRYWFHAMSDRVTTRPTSPSDIPLVSALHAAVFGPGRFTRTAYRVRERGTASGPAVSPFCRVAFLGQRLIASVTYTLVAVGEARNVALLGPLAVDPEFAGAGYGRRLIAESLDDARAQDVSVIVLVGDESYYGRFGFKRVPPGQITCPGPVDPGRILACELQPGTLAQCRGAVTSR
jgi:predicted N-acetyltransferase YhbS